MRVRVGGIVVGLKKGCESCSDGIRRDIHLELMTGTCRKVTFSLSSRRAWLSLPAAKMTAITAGMHATGEAVRPEFHHAPPFRVGGILVL